jgi:hypothetical protein
MNWGATIGTGVLGAIVGAAGMFSLALLWVRWFRVSSFEGKSGFFVVGLALVGGIAGLVIAMVAARIGRASLGPGASAWASQLGVGVGAVVGGLLLVLGVSYLQADLEPDLGGQGVALAWEVRLAKVGSASAGAPPEGHTDPREWRDDELSLELVSVRGRAPTGSEKAVFDRAAFRQEGGQWVLPARVNLFTSKGSLCVNLSLGGRREGFWPPIVASGASVQAAAKGAEPPWSAWYRTNESREKATDSEATMYRFRFVQAERATR